MKRRRRNLVQQQKLIFSPLNVEEKFSNFLCFLQSFRILVCFHLFFFVRSFIYTWIYFKLFPAILSSFFCSFFFSTFSSFYICVLIDFIFWSIIEIIYIISPIFLIFSLFFFLSFSSLWNYSSSFFLCWWCLVHLFLRKCFLVSLLFLSSFI